MSAGAAHRPGPVAPRRRRRAGLGALAALRRRQTAERRAEAEHARRREAALRVRLRALRGITASADPITRRGRITQMVGLVVESDGPAVEVGSLVALADRGAGDEAGDPGTLAEVVGFRSGAVLLMPLQRSAGLAPGGSVTALGHRLAVPCGAGLLGRVLNGLGRPIDGGGAVAATARRPAEADPPAPLKRRPITQPLPVGVRAIDGLLTCGRGQRLGVFAGSGVGKSTLLGMLCRHTAADVSVVALVGERGREVGEFIEADLGRDALRHSVVVVATSDEPPAARIKAALVATTIAEHFRDEGADVLLVMDSLTRFALAMREVGLASGEPPTTRGYTPSVFAALPRLLERSGTAERGSITGLYTVLVEGDDMNEPVADAVRGLLDGHVVLSRDIAAAGRYPAIDVLHSVSRLQDRLVDAEHAAAAARVRRILATMQQAQDLVDVGAYRTGTTPTIDHALRWIDPVRDFLTQERSERATFTETRAALVALGLGATAVPSGPPAQR